MAFNHSLSHKLDNEQEMNTLVQRINQLDTRMTVQESKDNRMSVEYSSYVNSQIKKATGARGSVQGTYFQFIVGENVQSVEGPMMYYKQSLDELVFRHDGYGKEYIISPTKSEPSSSAVTFPDPNGSTIVGPMTGVDCFSTLTSDNIVHLTGAIYITKVVASATLFTVDNAHKPPLAHQMALSTTIYTPNSTTGSYDTPGITYRLLSQNANGAIITWLGPNLAEIPDGVEGDTFPYKIHLDGLSYYIGNL